MLNRSGGVAIYLSHDSTSLLHLQIASTLLLQIIISMPTLGPINTPVRAARDTRMPAFTSALPPTDCTTKAKERSTTKGVDDVSTKSARKPLGTLQEPSINAHQPMAKVVHAISSGKSVSKPLSTLQLRQEPSINITERAATKEAQGNTFVSLYDAARFYKKEGCQTKQFREAVSQCLSRGYTVPVIARHIRESAHAGNLLVPGEKLYTRIYHRIYNCVRNAQKREERKHLDKATDNQAAKELMPTSNELFSLLQACNAVWL